MPISRERQRPGRRPVSDCPLESRNLVRWYPIPRQSRHDILRAAALPTSNTGTAAFGPTLPTWALQQVGSYLRHTGRDANIVAVAALAPKLPSTASQFRNAPTPTARAKASPDPT